MRHVEKVQADHKDEAARPQRDPPAGASFAPAGRMTLPGSLLGLQRTAGNRAVSQMVQRAIDLTEHENAEKPTRGHAMAQHVDVDDVYLKGRGKAVATRFTDLATANSMADKAIADGTIANKIEKMKRREIGNASGKVITGTNGVAYVKASDSYFGAKNVLFEAYPYTGSNASLKALGFYIQTMYPSDSTGTPV